MQIKRILQDDSSADITGMEAQIKMSTAHWTLLALLKMAVVTLVCGFIAGEERALLPQALSITPCCAARPEASAVQDNLQSVLQCLLVCNFNIYIVTMHRNGVGLRSSQYAAAAQELSSMVRSQMDRDLIDSCAGLFGIGGGVVLGPLLLSFGTHAKVAAATSNLMVLFSSSAAAIVYGLSGDLNLQVSLIFGFSCAVASLVGVFLISRAIDKSGKASIIVFLLSSIIAIGALMTGILGLRKAILDLIHRDHIGFSPLCGGGKS